MKPSHVFDWTLKENGQKEDCVAGAMVLSEPSNRAYDKTWAEIEEMLDAALQKQAEWKGWFEKCRAAGDREGMKDAARNHKALEGVVKTLRWVLGEEGIDHPLR